MARIGLFLTVVGLLLAVAAPAQARLVYAKGKSIYVANDDGSGKRRLVTGSSPRISPNGRWVVFMRSHSTSVDVRLIRASGGASRRIVRATEVRDLHFSPDSTLLGVALRDRLLVHEISSRVSDDAARGSIRGFSFSPDSESIVYGRAARGSDYDAPSDLYLLPATLPNPRRLTTDRRSRNPLWTARGILFNQQTARPGGPIPSYEIFEMQADGGSVRQVTNRIVDVDPLTYGPVPVAASADGERLVAGIAGQSRFDPYAIDVATGAARDLASDEQWAPFGISRDGSTVLLQNHMDPSDPIDIVTVPFTGGAAQTLVRNATGPSWTR